MYPNNIQDFLPSSVREGTLGPMGVGPDTYLARNGWPNSHSTEDTYEAPPFTWTPEPVNDIEYVAEFTSQGGAVLRKKTTTYKTIANFDTFADAQTAAEALNNHEGY